MDILQAAILSAVEGLTEFLPISSTGHMILASDLLRITQTDFVKSFEIVIQLGAIFAVVVLYFKTLLGNVRLWATLLFAFLPTALLGLLFYQVVKTYLLGNTPVTLLALLIGGIVFIAFEKLYKEKERSTGHIKEISLRQACIIGVCQSISMIPGVSRSAATILGGLVLGLNRRTAVEFSFLLAIPTMAAATALDLYRTQFAFTYEEYGLLGVGLVGAFITALLAIKFLLSFVQNHSFVPFGAYRIALAILFWIAVRN